MIKIQQDFYLEILPIDYFVIPILIITTNKEIHYLVKIQIIIGGFLEIIIMALFLVIPIIFLMADFYLEIVIQIIMLMLIMELYLENKIIMEAHYLKMLIQIILLYLEMIK